MTSLSEQFSAVRQSQLETQLDVFHKLTSRAIDSAEQLIALNLKTSRASVEQAAGTVQQLLHASDARDLFAIGARVQGPWQHLFAYSRELMGIATGVRTVAWHTVSTPAMPAPLLQMPAPFANLMEQVAIATADSATVHGEIAAAAADTGAALAESALDASVQAVPDASLRAAAQAADDAVEGAAQTSTDAATQLGAATELAVETAGEAAAAVPEAHVQPDVQPDAQPDLQPDAQPDSRPAEPQPDVTPGADESNVETPGEATIDAPRETVAQPGGDAVVEQPGGDAVELPLDPAGAIGAAGAPLVQAAAVIDAVAEVPTAKAKPLAKAVSKAVAKSLGAEHPLASAVPLQADGHVELPIVTPSDVAPPVQQSQGPAPEERRRSSRKK